MKTLKDLFLDGLADMYDAEHLIAKALPKMAKAATCDELKEAMHSHLIETEGHVRKIKQVFECFDVMARRSMCQAAVGLLEEGDEIAEGFKGSPAINAALIYTVQKVEHYEIASFGCLHEWAELLGNDEAAELLQDILEAEKDADESLTELARGNSNKEAVGEADEREANPPRAAQAASLGRKRAEFLV